MSRSTPRFSASAANESPFHVIRLFVVLCILLAGMPRVVLGFGPITIVEGYSATDSDDKKMAVATCPPGTIAFSGAASVHTFGSSEGIAVMYSHSTNNPPTEWVVMAQEMIATDENWFVMAYAFCADIPGYEYVSASVPFNSDDAKTIDVSCPLGTTMIGGGSAVIAWPGQQVLLNENRPKGNGWSATAVEFVSTENGWALGVRASCVPASDLDLEVISAYAAFQRDMPQVLKLSCAANRSAIGGGWALLGVWNEASVRISRIRPAEQQTWEVFADYLVWGVGYSLKAYAVCLSNEIFTDCFERGNTSAWSSVVP